MVEAKEEQWTYLGIQIWGGKKTFAFETPAGEKGYSKPGLPGYARPGSIFKVTVERDGDTTSITTAGANKPAYVAMIDDDDRRVRLEAASQAVETQIRMERKAKADMSDSALRELLAPLKAEYRRRNKVGRAALLGVIYEEIT